MPDSLFREQIAQSFRFFDGNSTHENGAPLRMKFLDLPHNGGKLLLFRFVNDILVIHTDHGFVCGNNNDIEIIDLFKLLRLSIGGTGHPG